MTVYAASLQELLAEAEQKFDNPSLQFLVEDQTLRIVGEASSPSLYQRLALFTAEHPEVINEVTIAEAVLATITHHIEEAIGIPGIKVRSVRNQIVLEGVAYSEAQARKAYEIAKLYAPDCLNLIEVRATDRNPGKEKMVQLDLYFMEIQKSALRSFGIQWAPGAFPAGGGNTGFGSGDGAAGIGGLGTSLIGFVLNLLPKIRFIRERGLGRVLENPTLFVKSGDLADFFSGVQVPYFASESVQFKEVGVKLSAQPIVSGLDIDLKLSTSISSPSPHIEGGINTHSVSTTAYIPSGQAVVLGGILSNRDVKTYHRVPREMATSSALFTLFLSKDFQTAKSELVVFILPKIVEQPSLATSAQEGWTRLEEQIIRDRSLKEYLEFMQQKGKPVKKRRGRR